MNTTISSASRDIENSHLTINGIRFEANTAYCVSDAPLKSQEYRNARISFAFGFSSFGGFDRAVFFIVQFISLETPPNGILYGCSTKSIVSESPPEDVFREISSLLTQTDRTPHKQDGSIYETIKTCMEAQMLSVQDFQHFFTQ